ncbi:dsRBD fold-containing protein [Streptomyces sp. CC208A]|uniref:dsRBD fold-containing protein n=1 Tax=Streptomyces sp. CC208A TaxID=3044573 RepID=UPI0024A8FBD1|nr:dsRBD fold-containing protein [Streptomyces sp. CC208A]
MTRHLEWRVGLELNEEAGRTEAEARLDTGTTTFTGHGTARCNPSDTDVPVIGDELAASRAMKDLAGKLMREANREMEAVGAGTVPGRTGPGYGWPEAVS